MNSKNEIPKEINVEVSLSETEKERLYRIKMKKRENVAWGVFFLNIPLLIFSLCFIDVTLLLGLSVVISAVSFAAILYYNVMSSSLI